MNANTAQTVLTERSLVKNFGAVKAFAGVDVTIPVGQPVAVMNPSGSGEPTFLRCLSGMFPVTSGEITAGGTSVASLNDTGYSCLRLKAFGFVFQSGQPIPELPASENVALPLVLAGASRWSAIRGTDSWLTKVELESERKRRSDEMSGGQAQRVAVARMLASPPSVISADESTGALDQATGYEIVQILTTTVCIGGATPVVITHDPNVVAWCGRLIEVRDRRIHADMAAKGVRS